MLIVLLIKISLYFYSVFALVIFLLLYIKKNSWPRQLTKETAFLASNRLGSLMVEWTDQAARSVTGTRSWNLTSWNTPQDRGSKLWLISVFKLFCCILNCHNPSQSKRGPGIMGNHRKWPGLMEAQGDWIINNRTHMWLSLPLGGTSVIILWLVFLWNSW